mgnify:FL=1
MKLAQLISDQARGIAVALFVIALICLGQRLDAGPAITDALQAASDVSESLAAEFAAQHASMATKD